MNKVLLAVILSGFSVQLIKLIIIWFKEKHLGWHDLIVTGGMPSSHSALVVSLTTIIYLTEGNSALFAISLVLAFIIVRDAFGVRRSVGKEGKQIEKLLKVHKIKSKFHYSIGHTPLQVFIGSWIGFLISITIYYLF